MNILVCGFLRSPTKPHYQIREKMLRYSEDAEFRLIYCLLGAFLKPSPGRTHNRRGVGEFRNSFLIWKSA